MAYDELLADRIRDVLTELVSDHLGELTGLTEKRIFGGYAFLLHGRLVASASSRGGMLLRVAPGDTDQLVTHAHVERFEMRKRPMDGWLHVAVDAVREDEDLRSWLERALAFVSTLPPKRAPRPVRAVRRSR